MTNLAEQLTISDVTGILTIICVAGAATWTVATMKKVVDQLVASMADLTSKVSELRTSVNNLTGRLDELETDHAATQRRIAKLEKGQE